MGASQSTRGSDTTGDGGASEVKTSYYELLGVERSATQDECVDCAPATATQQALIHPD